VTQRRGDPAPITARQLARALHITAAAARAMLGEAPPSKSARKTPTPRPRGELVGHREVLIRDGRRVLI
jgi:hypothetical protein